MLSGYLVIFQRVRQGKHKDLFINYLALHYVFCRVEVLNDTVKISITTR